MIYKGYEGSFSYDEDLDLFEGSISNIKTLIIFKGKSVDSTIVAFKDSINEYLEWCKITGRDPEKPSSEL